jgi:hypothetical protein
MLEIIVPHSNVNQCLPVTVDFSREKAHCASKDNPIHGSSIVPRRLLPVKLLQPRIAAMSTMSSMPGTSPLTPSVFQQTCGFCGCVFRVDITWPITYSPKLAKDTEDYACPECQRQSRIKTSTKPQVTLLSKRTDGRTVLGLSSAE